MASYPVEGIHLMENYDLAQKYSWDTASLLKLVKVQMCMKYQQINSRILHVIRSHALDSVKSASSERKVDGIVKSAGSDRNLDENIEAFLKQDLNFSRQSIEYRIKTHDKEIHDKDKQDSDHSVNSSEEKTKTDEVEICKFDVSKRNLDQEYLEVIEEEEVLDQMKHGDIDQLEIDMPNINKFFPKIEPDGSTKKVQFSHVGNRVSL